MQSPSGFGLFFVTSETSKLCGADCGAGNVHTILLHTLPLSKVLSISPAVPPSWTDVSFDQLRADGGLLVYVGDVGEEQVRILLVQREGEGDHIAQRRARVELREHALARGTLKGGSEASLNPVLL